MNKGFFWTKAKIDQAIAILRRYRADERGAALKEIRARVAPIATHDALDRVLTRAGLGTPLSYMRPPASRTDSSDPRAEKILHVLNRRKGAKLEDLCDLTDASPKRVRALLRTLRDRGVKIADVAGSFEIARKNEITTVQKSGIPRVVGRPVCAGVISDLHYGSRYCHEEWIADCVAWLYKRGARVVYCPGDFLTGDYKHSRFELTAVGLKEQTARACERLPRYPGLTYHLITGNHDDTFSDAVGIDTDEYIETFFRHHGRRDLRAYGRRGAFVDAQGIVVHLWHPRGPNPYAKTYELQKKIESYTPGQKPNILLAGHRHFFAYVIERGVHAFACPTFEGSGSPFGNSLKSQPQFGGMLLRWELTRDGTLRNFSQELRSYYENERPKKLRRA